MKLNLLVLLSVTTVCFAQNEPQVAVLQESLVKYKAESAEYMDRMNQLVVELKKMDANIESNIAKALEFTQKYTDSADTGERIMDSKKNILKDLIKSIERYTELENEVASEITKNRSYVREDLIKIRDWADAKIIMRVKQLTDVSTSLGGYDYYTSGLSGNDSDSLRGNGRRGDYDLEQGKRLADSAAKIKMDMIGKIKNATSALSERENDLEKELTNDKARRPSEDINNDLSSVKGKIAALEDAIDAISSKETTGKRVGKDASRAIVKEMRNQVSKIKSSSTSFFKSFDAMMRMLRKQQSLNITIEKYEFAIEQLNAGS